MEIILISISIVDTLLAIILNDGRLSTYLLKIAGSCNIIKYSWVGMMDQNSSCCMVSKPSQYYLSLTKKENKVMPLSDFVVIRFDAIDLELQL